MKNIEILESIVIWYNEIKHCIEIEEIQFSNEHTVRFVSGSKLNYPSGKKVNVYLDNGVYPTFLLDNDIKDIDFTHTIWGIEDGEILEPKELKLRTDINKGILFESSEDSDDGTYPLIMHYVSLVNKIDKDNSSVWLNKIANSLSTKNRLDIDYGVCRIVRKTTYDTKAILIFKEPIDVLITKIGEKNIIEKVSEIQGEFTHDYFWTRNGRQSKIANGFEIWFNIKKFLK